MLSSLDPEDPLVRGKVRSLAVFEARRYAMDPDDINDISQDVLFKLFTRRKTEVANKEGYLRRIVRTSTYDYFYRFYGGLKPSEIANIDDFQNKLILSDQSAKVENELILSELYEILNNDEREILRLYILGYNGKEIAVTLKIEPSTARMRLFRLFEKIKKMAFDADDTK